VIPDYLEAITAYRVFNVFENGLLAGSAFVEPWPPYQPFVARCATVSPGGSRAHVRDGQFVTAPVGACQCGIYAVKTYKAARQRLRMERQAHALWVHHPGGPVGRAWGVVKIWGRVIEHESGYRAEFAYPSHLYCNDAKLASRVAALYGVPCDYRPLKHREPVPSQEVRWATMDLPDHRQPFSYEHPQDWGVVGIGILLCFLSVALQFGGVTSHRPAAPAAERRADTERPTVEGAPFTAPAGWRIETRGPATIAKSPEGNSHIALVQVRAADADRAVNAAWAVYRPDMNWPLKVTVDFPDAGGWSNIRNYTYQTSPGEQRYVEANVRRKGDIWAVILSEVDQGAAEMQSARVGPINSRLFP
jgi:hypothetical protein